MFFIDTSYESSERMDLGKLCPFISNYYDVLPSYMLFKLKSLPIKGVTLVSTSNVSEEFRPDLISYRLYGDIKYKCLLMEYNSLISHLDVKIGTEIKYPSLADMDDLYYSLTQLVSQKGNTV